MSFFSLQIAARYLYFLVCLFLFLFWIPCLPLQQEMSLFLPVFFSTCFFFFFFFNSTNIANSTKRCFERNVLVCVYLIFIILFFSSFEFHEYLKLLRFQQVSCPESEVRHLSTTFQPLQNLDICIFNAIVFVFLSWDYLYVLELPSFFCNLFSISIFK